MIDSARINENLDNFNFNNLRIIKVDGVDAKSKESAQQRYFIVLSQELIRQNCRKFCRGN